MPERALLMLADIAGYTEFMRLHRLNLAHSQEITQQLLESMLDAVPALRLVEVEGNAELAVRRAGLPGPLDTRMESAYRATSFGPSACSAGAGACSPPPTIARARLRPQS